MTEYERLKRNSHEIVGRCAYSDCTIENHTIRASIDIVRYWGVNRPVHEECFQRFERERQRDGGTVVQSHQPIPAAAPAPLPQDGTR